MAHTCHATECKVNVPPQMFMCRSHWFSLPKILRDKVWDTYRPGQCDDMSPSLAYIEVAKDCITYIAKLEGKVPDIKLYEMLERDDE